MKTVKVMKKVFSFAAAVLLSLSASAQVYVGGGLGFKYQHVEGGGNATAFSLVPEVGYCINEKFAVGAQVGMDYIKVKGADGQTGWLADAYGRYTFGEVGSVKFFGELALGYEWCRVNGVTPGNFTIALRPGASVALSEKCSLVGRFDIMSYKIGNKYAVDTFNFGLLNGAGLEVGIEVEL